MKLSEYRIPSDLLLSNEYKEKCGLDVDKVYISAISEEEFEEMEESNEEETWVNLYIICEEDYKDYEVVDYKDNMLIVRKIEE